MRISFSSHKPALSSAAQVGQGFTPAEYPRVEYPALEFTPYEVKTLLVGMSVRGDSGRKRQKL